MASVVRRRGLIEMMISLVVIGVSHLEASTLDRPSIEMNVVHPVFKPRHGPRAHRYFRGDLHTVESRISTLKFEFKPVRHGALDGRRQEVSLFLILGKQLPRDVRRIRCVEVIAIARNVDVAPRFESGFDVGAGDPPGRFDGNHNGGRLGRVCRYEAVCGLRDVRLVGQVILKNGGFEIGLISEDSAPIIGIGSIGPGPGVIRDRNHIHAAPHIKIHGDALIRT